MRDKAVVFAVGILLMYTVIIRKGEALTCYMCGFLNYVKGQDTSVQGAIDSMRWARGAIGTDANCVRGGVDYTSSSTTYTTETLALTCLTSCEWRTGYASYEVQGVKLRYVIHLRGCADADNDDAKDTCSKESHYHTSHSQALLNMTDQPGSTFRYEDAVFCYCSTDLCNTGRKLTGFSNLLIFYSACLFCVHLAIL